MISSSRSEELQSKRIQIQQNVDSFTAEVNLENNTEYMETKRQIAELESKVSEPASENLEFDALRSQKSRLANLVYACRCKLGSKEQNDKIKIITFKLFNILVNGAVEECCEAFINGVPFSDANTASQINGGLDIINALCDHYNVRAPIFIDNRKSVNEILKCDSQLINLIVSKDKTLIVEASKCGSKKHVQPVLEGLGF